MRNHKAHRFSHVHAFIGGTTLAVVALFFAGAAFAQESHIGKLSGNAKLGKQYYRRYCVGCHGPDGDGLGENAPWLDPKPRDFTLGTFKCRSTPSGSLPLDEDLFQTVGRGVDVTGMPSWLPLLPQVRADLVAYIKTFSPRFHDEKPDPAIAITPETPSSPESVKRGEVLYQETLKCVQCHGTTGTGDGPSASTLRDNKDAPIVPYNFRVSTRFKCGDSDEDLYRIFMTGLDGTPMPSYADYLKPDQAWDLVHYLRSLQLHYKPKHAANPPKEPNRDKALKKLATERDTRVEGR
jgi:mono/diheme cytochrome c family protein